MNQCIRLNYRHILTNNRSLWLRNVRDMDDEVTEIVLHILLH